MKTGGVWVVWAHRPGTSELVPVARYDKRVEAQEAARTVDGFAVETWNVPWAKR